MLINFNYLIEFASISKLIQSREDKLNSKDTKDITEKIFLNLFET